MSNNKTIHIEVAESLDKVSCLAAVTRFNLRTGYPNTTNIDNGTNFDGVANELKTFLIELYKAEVESDLAQEKIVSKLNPPRAPHCSGT